MISQHLSHWRGSALALATLAAAACLGPVRADEPANDDGGHRMEVTSSTFTAGSSLPLSMIDNITENGVNACSVNGATGGDESPQLAWSHVPPNTRSFVVVLYDPTAAFTHWGMYNIPRHTRTLPENAGVAGSTYGVQIENDFGDFHYDGPCPPAGVAPFAHRYVFTVYALDTELTLPSSANFPANAETLYHALIRAGRDGHILASARIAGFYSSTPAN